MNKMIVTLAVLLSTVSASAYYTSTTGCTDENKQPVLFVLSRVAQEKQAKGEDVSGLSKLAQKLSAGGEVALSDTMLRDAGLSDVQIHEIGSILNVKE